jgi:calcium/calmodulin-dependent protein kinase I
LCFDLCTGGELFDRICKKGNYYEQDAAELVRTVLKAVEYLHICGVVHRGQSCPFSTDIYHADTIHIDLKPENLLFRTPAEEADIMIADFGLSRIMDDDQLTKLTEVCGTPGVSFTTHVFSN